MRNQPTTCKRCNRELTSVTSIARGYGAWCARLAAADEAAEAALQATIAATLNVTVEQAGKALELLADGGLVKVETGNRFGDVHYLAVSEDGTRLHRCTATFCDCEATKPCYHMVAVAVGEDMVPLAGLAEVLFGRAA